MKYVFASYVYTGEFNNPMAWLKRINAYAGILQALAVTDTVVSFEQINYEGELHYNSVQHYFVRFPQKQRRFPSKLHQLIKAQQPDVVIIQGLHFPLQVMQLRVALGRHVRIMVQHRAERPYTGIRKYLMRAADKGVDVYLFASKRIGQKWVDGGNIGNADKIYQIMPVSSVFSSINRAEALSKTGMAGRLNFLWIGNLNANKDPLTVIKAFLRFAEQQPEARLYIIHQTDDLLGEIYALLQSWPLVKDNICLIGRIAHADMQYWLNGADFIISGSHSESAGAAIAEAMSCGCIPIVTDIDSFRVLTENGRYGWLYKPGDETALYNVLMQTLYIKLSDMRNRVSAHFNSQFSFTAIAEQMKAIMASLFKQA